MRKSRFIESQIVSILKDGDAGVPLADLVRSAGVNAYACEPLLVRGELLGTLSFASRSRRRFDADDLTFFRIIAKHLAMARSSAPYRAGLSTSGSRRAQAALA